MQIRHKVTKEVLLSISGDSLEAADLHGAQLHHANLRRALLLRTDLSGADLSGASLRYANLSFANLEGADLRNANMTGAVLHRAQLQGARYNHETEWPLGFNASAAGAIADGEPPRPAQTPVERHVTQPPPPAPAPPTHSVPDTTAMRHVAPTPPEPPRWSVGQTLGTSDFKPAAGTHRQHDTGDPDDELPPIFRPGSRVTPIGMGGVYQVVRTWGAWVEVTTRESTTPYWIRPDSFFPQAKGWRAVP